MNTRLAAEEEIDEFDDFESESRFAGLSLRDGETDLFRGVLVALLALAVGALVLTQGYSDDTVESATDDTAITSGELTAADPDGTLTSDEVVTADPAAPDADATADGAVTDDAMTDSSAADGTATVTSDPTSTSSTTATSTPANTARPPGEVEVVVLNGTDRKGIAGQGTELLQIAGYAIVPAGNATNAAGSVIYYLDDYRADAIAVSEVFSGGLEGLVQPFDPTSPPAAAEDIGDAKVIVVLGVDDAIPIG